MNGCVIATYRCNSRCHMCDIWKYPSDRQEEITPDIVANIPSGLGRVNLTGGEPMMRDDIEEIVYILRGKARLVEISTNVFFTERIIGIAKRFPRGVMFRISIEGLASLNDKLRGVREGFEHALRTVIELGKIKVKDYGFSIVICDKNASDLLAVYDLACSLGVELGNSTMHNSWYFHKTDNRIEDKVLAISAEKEFIKRLLDSQRKDLSMRLKDWFRAYFNLNILKHMEGKGTVVSSCCAGEDLFFLDPFGNVAPCNGTEKEWIMGNLKEQSWEELWNSKTAEDIRGRVARCRRECAFIQTARIDMLRRPLKPLMWILKNKFRLLAGKDIEFD
jgi:Fe-coproporphyrin III synthase